MPPQLLDLVKRSAAYLAERGIVNARREAEWIFAEALGLSRIDLYTRFDMPLDAAEVERLRALVMRRGRREPLAYVLGTQDFMGLRLAVGPGVLVPRPETEELVEAVLKELPSGPARVLDVGTGSGAIALALKRARPDCEVEGVDRSESALAFARRNAAALGLAVAFVHGHLGQGRGGYQVVVANLPYIAEIERAECDPELAFEPVEALFAGADGLDLIRELVADARRLLVPGGTLWLEHGWHQGPAIAELCRGQGLPCAIRQDLAGRDRIARIPIAEAMSTPSTRDGDASGTRAAQS
jgi:release factor glutamine methyltransferase